MAADEVETRFGRSHDRTGEGAGQSTRITVRGFLAFLLSVLAVNAVAMDITQDTRLDPDKVYGPLVIRSSNITIDGGGAWLIGDLKPPGNKLKGIAVLAAGVSNVTLKNVNAKGWETGLKIIDGSGWTIEN